MIWLAVFASTELNVLLFLIWSELANTVLPYTVRQWQTHINILLRLCGLCTVDVFALKRLAEKEMLREIRNTVCDRYSIYSRYKKHFESIDEVNMSILLL